MTRAGWAALAAIAVCAFLGSWVVLGHLWYHSTPQIVDTPGYEQYGVRNRVLEQGWPGGLEVLEKDWKPYLEGKVGLEAAVRAMVEDYGVPVVQGMALHHINGRRSDFEDRLAGVPVAGGQFAGLQGVENAQDFVGIAAD